MDILVTGHIGLISEELFARFDKKTKIVVCGDEDFNGQAKNIIPYQFSTDSIEFEKLFVSYNFRYVIYVSYCMEEKAFQELKCLERVLSLCRGRDEVSFIYLNPSDVVTSQLNKQDIIVRNAALELCTLHKEKGYSLLDIRVPYLAGQKGTAGNFIELLKKAYKEKELCFETEASQKIDVLFEEDLSELIHRLVEEEEKGYFLYTISGKNERTLPRFAEELKQSGLNCEVKYGTKGAVELTEDTQAIDKYGWFPMKNVENFLTDWIEALREASLKQREENIPKDNKMSKVIAIVEFIFMYVVCEVLTRKTSNLSLINYVDFRMFFVVISGMMYGLKYGMAAALLSCMTYFVGGDLKGNWQIQFYNIINWLPFAVYLLSGAIAGYTKDTYTAQLKSRQEEQEILENKYIYLNELYTSTLENKEQYSVQIANYVNSFGRIYDVTKQLNSVLPGEIYNVAINIMEDMLENQNVAIYAIDGNSSFARLNICSRKLNDELARSIDLEKRKKMTAILQANETWVNKERLEGYPDYAYPIYKENKLAGIIMLLHVGYRQMNMDYRNRFQILAGLISDSLIRAMEHQELLEHDIMLPNTRIWKAEAFEQEVEMQKQMKENNRADYILLRIISNEKDYVVLDKKLQMCIRQRDKIGIGSDNQLYMLLTQADENSARIVKGRLKDMDINLEMV